MDKGTIDKTIDITELDLAVMRQMYGDLTPKEKIELKKSQQFSKNMEVELLKQKLEYITDKKD